LLNGGVFGDVDRTAHELVFGVEFRDFLEEDLGVGSGEILF
jgi:hypothetical protein